MGKNLVSQATNNGTIHLLYQCYLKSNFKRCYFMKETKTFSDKVKKWGVGVGEGNGVMIIGWMLKIG
jgi:hypothetical protein